jgi:signal transduction histidine kinase
MSAEKPRINGLFSEPIGGETVRAFLVFSVLLVALAGIAGQLIFRELNLQALARRASVGHEEAARIADAVAALGRDQGGINFHLLGQKTQVLRQIVLERLADLPFVLDVEVRDRFGGRLLYVSRDALGPPEPGRLPPDIGEPRTVTVPLMRGAVPEGEVRVGISGRQAPAELEKLRASLRVKLVIATSIALALLAVGFLYVLYLIRKNRQLEQSRLAAERRSYVGLLASGLAHEIRNPLNAMNMNLQMLEEEMQAMPGLDAGDLPELLTSTKSEIKRLENLASNFLQYARPGSPRFEARDLNEVLQDVAMFLQADFRQRGVELQADLEPLLPTVDLDETQFKQAVINLLVNARQVVGDGGVVQLVSRAGSSGEVVVEVRDNGPGVPEEAREKVFEVFYSSRGGGTGLGLPIARQIVERHGGTIGLETKEGEGATFRIRLPRRHPAPRPSPETAKVVP